MIGPGERQTWIVKGIRCGNGHGRIVGPEAKADGTQAYLSLPVDAVDDDESTEDIWLAEPEVMLIREEALCEIAGCELGIQVMVPVMGQEVWVCKDHVEAALGLREEW